MTQLLGVALAVLFVVGLLVWGTRRRPREALPAVVASPPEPPAIAREVAPVEPAPPRVDVRPRAGSVRSMLFDVDPYAGFRPRKPADGKVWIEGWCANCDELLAVAKVWRPRLMVEVGSWKGLSANIFAQEMKAQWERDVSRDSVLPVLPALPLPELVCVDTWLGSGEFMGVGRDPSRDLRRVNGWPMVYFDFLSNMALSGLSEIVTPWPCPSIIAARCLRAEGLLFDAIYIDASHEYEDVRADLAAWWPLVRPGGVLFGDDYDDRSDPGVVGAVMEFDQRKTLKIAGRMWSIEKPGEIAKPTPHEETRP